MSTSHGNHGKHGKVMEFEYGHGKHGKVMELYLILERVMEKIYSTVFYAFNANKFACFNSKINLSI